MAAQAIMTTDLVPKQAAVRLALSGGQVTIGAVQGQRHDRAEHGYVFCFLTTDAEASAGTLQRASTGPLMSLSTASPWTAIRARTIWC